MQIIFHIDVNNAFLSWTAIDLLNQGYTYDIRNSYAVIGGDEDKRRGIVVAKSMPCKKLGIVTAETLYSARKKCPSLKVYPANFSFYKKMSDAMFELISTYSPDIEILSIDECFLDYTKVKNLYGDPISFAHKLQNEIKEKLGFTVNIGIAENKLCAKMASDFEKPNKIHTLFSEEIETKLWPLPVRDLYGVGKSSTEKLKMLDIKTIGQLAKADENLLYKFFKNNAHYFIESANGRNDSPVVSEKSEAKGISNSTTLEKDYTKLIEINEVLRFLSDNVAHALKKENKYAMVIAVQMKDKFFKNSSHQRKLTNAVSTSKEIYEISKALFKELWKEEPVRLLGIRLDHLTTKPHYQVSLFEDLEEVEDDKSLEDAIYNLKEKYGTSIIAKGNINHKKIQKKYNE